MNRLLYNLFIQLFELVIWLFAFFNQKARLFINGRKLVNSQLSVLSYSKFKRRIWFHTASLGEFEQARPIIEGLRAKYPEIGIIVTFFSPSGYEVMKDYRYADKVLYLPMDTPKKASEFVKLLKPDIAIFIKYEFWFNYLNLCIQQQIPVIYVSAIFRKDQIYFNRAKSLYLPVFRNIDKFFVQDVESFGILRGFNIHQAVICGDTRLDRVHDISEISFEDQAILSFCSNSKIIVFGSIWPSDIHLIDQVIASLSEGFKIIIAPHNVDLKSIKELTDNLQRDSVLHSSTDATGAKNGRIMIIDSIGMLSKVYRLGSYNYVGGAFNGGLHNILEPAVYGKPVFFGDHESNIKFKEASELLQSGGAIAVNTGDDIVKHIKNFEGDEKLLMSCGDAAANYVEFNRGATTMVLEYLQSKI